MKDEEKLQLLLALIKGARRSDIELSKITGNTRATVTRRRRQLETEGYIKEYTVLPEFTKIGYTILAFSFLTINTSPIKEDSDRKLLFDWFEKHNFILFAAVGEGLARNILMTLHKNYSDFSEYISTLREDTQQFYKDLQFFVVDLNRKDTILQPFSFARIDSKSTDISQKDYHLIKSKKTTSLWKEASKKVNNIKGSN